MERNTLCRCCATWKPPGAEFVGDCLHPEGCNQTGNVIACDYFQAARQDKLIDILQAFLLTLRDSVERRPLSDPADDFEFTVKSASKAIRVTNEGAMRAKTTLEYDLAQPHVEQAKSNLEKAGAACMRALLILRENEGGAHVQPNDQ